MEAIAGQGQSMCELYSSNKDKHLNQSCCSSINVNLLNVLVIHTCTFTLSFHVWGQRDKSDMWPHHCVACNQLGPCYPLAWQGPGHWTFSNIYIINMFRRLTFVWQGQFTVIFINQCYRPGNAAGTLGKTLPQCCQPPYHVAPINHIPATAGSSRSVYDS